MTKPYLEPEFKPAIIEFRNFFNDVNKQDEKETIVLAIERNNGYIYRREFNVFKEGIDDERNTFIIERYIKSVLWVVGGYKIYIHGSKKIYENIHSYYQEDGLRKFDFNFMSTVYEKPFEVIYVEDLKDMPNEKKCSLPAGGFLKGNRVGFDAGGSDIKISAVVDGEVIFSEEVVWLPKLNEDINYHYENIYKVMMMAVEKMNGKCDGIGISTAGVIIDDRPMVSSLFIKVPEENFELVKGVYIISASFLLKHIHQLAHHFSQGASGLRN